ncbi:unnamed protein product [Pleuronectes platessa]|uniref:Uncharacterized protein n=1 Tax=Pleuronectes platessa TaxID=8262 RepID=A0A9N7VNT2_PLEPL|nr:unnamed protein product [Pleuronectes platessa]
MVEGNFQKGGVSHGFDLFQSSVPVLLHPSCRRGKLQLVQEQHAEWMSPHVDSPLPIAEEQRMPCMLRAQCKQNKTFSKCPERRLLTMYTALVSEHLSPGSVGNDGDICTTQTEKRTFKRWNNPSGCHTTDPCVRLCAHLAAYFGQNSPMSSWTDGSHTKIGNEALGEYNGDNEGTN